MKSRCLYFVFALGCFTAGAVGGAVPAAAPAKRTGPKIQFANTTHDFGKIGGGEVVKAEFIFTNIGTALLEIPDVKPGCGCTVAEWTKKVEPGKTGVVVLQFNSGSFVGNVGKNATVFCNDPVQPQVPLSFKANIWRAIEVNPQWAVLNLTSENPSNATTVRIVNNLEQPLKLSDLECKNPGFAAELKTIKEGKEFELIVKTVPPYPTGSAQVQITMKSSATNMPVITVSAWANVQQTITLMPAQVTLQPGPLANKVTQTISIRSTSSNEVTVSEPLSTIKGVELQLTNFTAGRYFVLTAVFPAGMQLGPNGRGELSVKTSHPQYPVLKIPVYQSSPPPPSSALQMIPQYAILYLTPESPSNAATIRITNHLAQPVAITNVESKNPSLAAELKTVREGKEYQLIVKTVPPYPTNSAQSQITLRTTSPTTPVLNLTAWANYQQTVLAMPTQLAVPAGTLTNKVTQTVWIRNNGTNPITLLEPQVNAKDVEVKVNAFQPGKYFNLTVTFPPGFQMKPDEKVQLSVKTSHPNYPEIKVPVVQTSARLTPPPVPAAPNLPNSAIRPIGR